MFFGLGKRQVKLTSGRESVLWAKTVDKDDNFDRLKTKKAPSLRLGPFLLSACRDRHLYLRFSPIEPTHAQE